MQIRRAVLEFFDMRAFRRSRPVLSRPLVLGYFELDSPGFGEVLVRIEAAGLRHSALSSVDGTLASAAPMFPMRHRSTPDPCGCSGREAGSRARLRRRRH